MKKNRVGKPTQDPILDAAERLFAGRGFYGVSVRNITQAAGVDVALVSYHFGAKRALFTAVFERRAELLNVERLALLEEERRAYIPNPPPVEALSAPLHDLCLIVPRAAARDGSATSRWLRR
jgi:AcrR family transcriptional regulator